MQTYNHSCWTQDKCGGKGVLTEAARSAQATKSTLYKNPFLPSTPLNLAHLGNQAGDNTEKEQHNPNSLKMVQATMSFPSTQINATDLFLKSEKLEVIFTSKF